MTHPLAEFGLEEDADERAVKRAYAKRLKVTRPDEDAAAFQALNEAYQRALGFIRWRDAQTEEEGEDGEEMEPVSAPDAMFEENSEPQFGRADIVFRPDFSPDRIPQKPLSQRGKPEFTPETKPEFVPETKPQAPIFGAAPHPDNLFDQDDAGPEDPPQEYIFSVVEFTTDMCADGRHSNSERFGQWIREHIADWPITARPVFARAVIGYVLENRVPLYPDIYDILVEELGLNDINSTTVDPMEILQYRDLLARRYDADIFTPAPPTVMRASWFHSRRTELASVIFLCVCGVILVAMSFLQKTPEAPNNPWYQSPPGSTSSSVSINMSPGMYKAAIDLLNSTADMSRPQAVQTLDKIIARLSDRTELGNERLLALALYNKGHALQHDDRDRGYAAYGELQKRFKSRRDHDLALFVAASYVNMGLEDYLHDRLDTAMSSYVAVISQYGFITEGQIGMQVYKAMFGKAEVYAMWRKYDEALQILTEIGVKFGNSSDPVLRTTATDQAAELRAKVNKNRKSP